MSGRATTPTEPPAVTWHDVECGIYAEDLPLWERLAAAASGPVLELGCGTGRVALHLARAGFDVTALDHDAELIAALRARARGLAIDARIGDVWSPGLERRFGLVAAPMQLIQVVGDHAARRATLQAARSLLAPGGRAAFAIVDGVPAAASGDGPPPLPDVAEFAGHVYSSLPLGVARDGEWLIVRRLRQVVSPAGDLTERIDETRLALIDADRLEAEAAEVGLTAAGRVDVAATAAHVGSRVVLLEAADG